MDILKHPLIMKYFESCAGHVACGRECMSFHILKAMQEPIKKGEEVLQIVGERIYQEKARCDYIPFHPFALRLPDSFQFQPQEKKCECGLARNHVICQPKPEPEKCKCEWHNPLVPNYQFESCLCKTPS